MLFACGCGLLWVGPWGGLASRGSNEAVAAAVLSAFWAFEQFTDYNPKHGLRSHSLRQRVSRWAEQGPSVPGNHQICSASALCALGNSMPKRPDQRPPRILESGKERPETSRNEVSRHRAIRAPHAAAACCFMPLLIALRRRPGGRLVAQRQRAQGHRHPSAGVKVVGGILKSSTTGAAPLRGSR